MSLVLEYGPLTTIDGQVRKDSRPKASVLLFCLATLWDLTWYKGEYEILTR